MVAVVETDEREREGGRVVLGLLVGLFVLFAGAYAAAHLFSDRKLPPGTTIQGVAVGGQTVDHALATLTARLEPASTEPVRLSIDGRPVSVDPAQAGLGVDFPASVAQVPVGAGWNPQELFDYFTGGDSYDAVVSVDDRALTQAVTAATQGSTRAPMNGALTFTRSGDFRVHRPVTGHGVDVPAAVEQVKAAYLTGDPVRLTTVATEPAIGDQAIRQAISDFANQAVSGPVTLNFGDASIRLRPTDYLPAFTMVPSGSRLVPRLDAQALKPVLDANLSGSGTPVDATFRVQGDRAFVVPSKLGVSYDLGRVAKVLPALVAAPDGRRSAEVPATVAKPAFNTRAAKKLGIKELVSQFTTYFPYAEYRNINLPRAAELIDGTVLKPGETFSLNGTVGERTRANGFTSGWTIRDGQYFEDLGGGVSQITTTTFNAAFFAGMTDVEHQPHSFYIDRYPEGREATVAWPSVDMKFRNDTPYGVLVKEYVTKATPTTSGVVTVKLYSTKYWNITTTKGPRTNVTDYQTLHQSGAKCFAHSGYPGFDVDVKRYWRRVGDPTLVRTETMHTHYAPEDAVTCS